MTSKKRSLLKAVTWRLAGSLTTISVVWVYTNNIQLSACAATIDLSVKIAAYYAHERVWDRIEFGRIIKRETYNEFIDKNGRLSFDDIIKEAQRLKAIEESLPKKGEDQNGQ